MRGLWRAVLTWLGLPGDFHWWWAVGIPFLGSTVMSAALAFIREAPPWQVVLAFVGGYIFILAIGASVRRRWFASQDSAASTSPDITINI